MRTFTGNFTAGIILLAGLVGFASDSRAGVLTEAPVELTGIDTALADLLGTSVAVSGDVAVIGSPFADPGGLVSAGSAYLFQRNEGGVNTWAQRKKLLSSSPLAGDQFGYAVAVDRDVIAVCSAYADVGGLVNQGLITVFQRDAGGANQWGEVAQLVAGDGAAGDLFGISVAIDGNVMVVGAMLHDTSGINSAGAAYVFERRTTGVLNEWIAAGKLTATSPSPIGYFGASVDVEGDVIAVGAPGFSGGVAGIGQVHIFERNASSSNTWANVAVLQALDAAPGATFGQAVALANGVLVVGAPGPSTSPATNAGSAYCFARTHAGANGWQQMAKLVPSDATPGQDFARTVEICGDLAFVGASRVNHAYLFQRDAGGENAWGEVARINAPAGVGSIDRFGADVAVGPGHLLIGAPGAGSSDGGAAYLFPLIPEDWVRYGNRTQNNRVAGDEFGSAVDMDGSVMIVGAPLRDLNGTNDVGAVYIFERGTNDQVRRLLAPTPGADDRAGFAVAVEGDVAVVGVPLSDFYATNAGEAHVYHRNQGGSNNWGRVSTTAPLIPTAQPPGANENFGQAVDISGDTIIIGRPGRTSNIGRVDFYGRYKGVTNGWEYLGFNSGSVQFANRYFGASVSIDGDTAVVGAHGDNFTSGAVHILQRQQSLSTPWSEVKRIPSPDAELNDAFGRNVSLSGDSALVSSYSLRKAYVFERDRGGVGNWGQAAVLIPTSTAEVVFGGINSVHLDGDFAVLGDPFAVVQGVNSAGAAWIFARNAGGSNAWGQIAVVRSDTLSLLARFGWDVAVHGQALLAGAPTDDPNGVVDAGRASVFTGFLYGAPEITSMTQTGNVFSMTFPTQPGWNYSVDGTFDLVGPSWIPIPHLTNLPGETDGFTTILHTNIFNRTLYRVQRSEP